MDEPIVLQTHEEPLIERDQRASPRVPVIDIKALVRPHRLGPLRRLLKPLVCQVINIGLGGVRLHGEEVGRLRYDGRVDLWLRLPGGEMHQTTARVRYLDSHGHHCGLQFETVPSELRTRIVERIVKAKLTGRPLESEDD